MSDKPAANETWIHYAALRDHLIEMIGELNDSQLATAVPMCPEWTVKDVVAHVCGLNNDLASGITEGLGSDERTSHHVALRSAKTLDEVCAEWQEYDAAMSAISEETPLWATRLAADLTVHLHDVQHALGLPIDQNDRFTIDAARQYASVFQNRVGEILGLGVAIELSEGSHNAANPELPDSGVALRASPFDFLRSFTGRRSRRQVDSLDWTGDPTRILDEAWSPYGPFQPNDVIDS